MNLANVVESGAIVSIIGAIAYAVNKWLIPAYKGLKKEIEELRKALAEEIEKRSKLEIILATLKERYAEKTVLKSHGKKNKKKND